MHPIETPKSKTTKTKPKTKFETIIIEYKNIKYEIIIDKLLCLIRILKNEFDFEFKNKEHIFEILKEYKLYDEVFLEKINEIYWISVNDRDY